ncbi:MAG: hypothetical protein GY795_32730 [Desulfobacterales bacterium]|nr:hypothetical protein [Desulfobacterales bacterium]
MLHKYSDRLRKAIEKFENYGLVEFTDFREELRAGKQAIINIEIRLINGSVLFIREYIDAKYKLERIRYAYQYHDKNGGLIFRYDNAAHKPSLEFKEHKHLSDGKIVHADPPEIFDLLDEVVSHL